MKTSVYSLTAALAFAASVLTACYDLPTPEDLCPKAEQLSVPANDLTTGSATIHIALTEQQYEEYGGMTTPKFFCSTVSTDAPDSFRSWNVASYYYDDETKTLQVILRGLTPNTTYYGYVVLNRFRSDILSFTTQALKTEYRVGETIEFPTTSAPSGQNIAYTIEKGDFLATVANTYNYIAYIPLQPGEVVITATQAGNVKKTYTFKVTSNGKHGTQNGHEWVDLGLPSGVKWATCNVGASAIEENGLIYANEKKNSAVTSQWGNSWRVPTQSEMEELKSNCSATWGTYKGIGGYLVKGESGGCIFLPAADYNKYSSHYGNYWSSTSNNYFQFALHNFGAMYSSNYSSCYIRPVTD